MPAVPLGVAVLYRMRLCTGVGDLVAGGRRPMRSLDRAPCDLSNELTGAVRTAVTR